VELPMILYNVPSRTGIGIAAESYKELSQHPNINGVKEASGDFALVNEIFHRCGDSLNVWAGNDDITVPILAMGGCGVISTAGNVIPRVMADICARWFSGEHEAAALLQREYYDVMRDLFLETNPIPAKTAVNLIGLPGGEWRLPLCEMTDENLAKLKNTLKKHGLIAG
jgi:4-hydroxy-tetrahydrodipicolinate synthase